MTELQSWADYLVAQVTASAALTGLIFVVLSFNFDQIVGDKAWPGRAGTGLVLLASRPCSAWSGCCRYGPPVRWAGCWRLPPSRLPWHWCASRWPPSTIPPAVSTGN